MHDTPGIPGMQDPRRAHGMKQPNHAWLPTNSERTFHPSGPITTPTVCFPTSLSFGEASTPEAQGSAFPVSRVAAGRAQPTTLTGPSGAGRY